MRDDHEGPVDRAKRDAERDRSKEEEAAKARKKSESDARLKDERGKEVFERLRAWMDEYAKSYSSERPKQAFEVGAIKRWGGPDDHDFFRVSSAKGERLPMEISYREAPHGITAECGVVPSPQYFLSVDANGELFFESSKRQLKTIEELGSELLDRWKAPI